MTHDDLRDLPRGTPLQVWRNGFTYWQPCQLTRLTGARASVFAAGAELDGFSPRELRYPASA